MTEFLNMLLDQIGIIIVGGLILYYMTRGFAEIRREIRADIAEMRKESADFRREIRDELTKTNGKVDNLGGKLENVVVELAVMNGKLDNTTAEIAKTNDKVDKLNNIVVANDTVIAMFKDNKKANTN